MKLVADQRRVKISELNEDMYNKMKRCRAVEKEAWRNLSDYEDEVKGYCDDIDKTTQALVCIVFNSQSNVVMRNLILVCKIAWFGVACSVILLCMGRKTTLIIARGIIKN